MNTQKRNIVIACLATALLVTGVISSFLFRTAGSQKKQEYLQVSQELTELQQQNEELNSLLNTQNENELYEHFAREHDYVYPGEKVYYDVTPR